MENDYTILVANDASSLSSQVNNLLRHGWEPQGGVTVTTGRETPDGEAYELWAQAMIKRTPADAGDAAASTGVVASTAMQEPEARCALAPR